MQSVLDNKALLVGAGLLALLVGVLLLLAIGQMLFRGRLRLPGGRTRQARLGIVDAFDLDRQRQLIIVRRDNTEHLIMIGGPNDLLIESEILRVEARETRRDKIETAGPTLPIGQGFGEPRIPAPLLPMERGEPTRPSEYPPGAASPPQAAPAAAKPQAAPRPEPQPAAPPPQSQPTSPGLGEGEAAARRMPTFPVPPRRPLPTAEPRPLPRSAENVTRAEPVPPPAPEPSPAPASPVSNVPVSNVPAARAPAPAVAQAPAPEAPPATAPAGRAPEPTSAPAARPVPPQFLRPLPPRPPNVAIRANPVAKPAPAPATPASTPAPHPASEAPASAPPSQPGPPSDAGRDRSNDTLESLEEEMAKLLGRGPGET
jgi:flagellar protein FliO/FliZ